MQLGHSAQGLFLERGTHMGARHEGGTRRRGVTQGYGLKLLCLQFKELILALLFFFFFWASLYMQVRAGQRRELGIFQKECMGP